MDLDTGSRQRIWEILEGWWEAEPRGMGMMLWRDPAAPMGVTLASFGAPKRRIVEFEEQWALARRAAPVSTASGDPA
jgi:CRISPR-associated protein Cas2